MKLFVFSTFLIALSGAHGQISFKAVDESLELCNPFTSAASPLQIDATEHCSFFPYEVCSPAGICEHKSVFPVLPFELIGLIVMPLMLGIASVAGLGGGVVFVPLLMAFYHFKTKDTVAISLAIVF